MGQHEIVGDVEERQWRLQAILVLAQRGDPAADRRHALANSESQSLHQCRGDLPATHRYDLFYRTHGPEPHPVLHSNHALTPGLLDALRLQQSRQRQPAGLGHWALGWRALRLVPHPAMAQDGGPVACEAVAQPPGHTA
jgi:hypothetical protein